jgi:hypothetical protein
MMGKWFLLVVLKCVMIGNLGSVVVNTSIIIVEIASIFFKELQLSV